MNKIKSNDQRKHEIEFVGNIIGRLMHNLGETKLKYGFDPCEIRSEWNALVGAEISQHARPVQFQKGILTIAVDSSVWLHELNNFAKPVLLKTLQEKWPWINALRFRSGTIS